MVTLCRSPGLCIRDDGIARCLELLQQATWQLIELCPSKEPALFRRLGVEGAEDAGDTQRRDRSQERCRRRSVVAQLRQCTGARGER
eukprot:5464274-Prymnesium_polylepis.1